MQPFASASPPTSGVLDAAAAASSQAAPSIAVRLMGTLRVQF
jgi:hypothetical protein